MCNIWKNKNAQDINTETLRRISLDPFFKNLEIVAISGGEPTLHNDLKDVVEAVDRSADNLQKLIVTSNGLRTDRMTKQIELVASYCSIRNIPFSFRISLDGLEENHNAVRRIPNAFKKTVESIVKAKELSQKYDFSFGLSSTFTPMNVYDAGKLQKFADDIGVDIVYYFAWESDFSFKNRELEKKILLDDEARKYLIRFYQEKLLNSSLFDGEGYSYEFQIKHLQKKTDRTMLCPFANQGLMLDANGDVHYCINSKVIGNLSETAIQDIYFDRKNIEYRKHISKTLCKRCYAGCMAQVAARKNIYPYLFYLARLANYKLSNKNFYT